MTRKIKPRLLLIVHGVYNRKLSHRTQTSALNNTQPSFVKNIYISVKGMGLIGGWGLISFVAPQTRSLLGGGRAY